MDILENKQINYILDLFKTANKSNKFIFIKGGWNIDLQSNQITRSHNDIDIHFNYEDKDFWISHHRTSGYLVDIKDDYYIVFKHDDLVIDFEAVTLLNHELVWKHGNKSKLDEVVISYKYDGHNISGMNLNVEKYLKERHDNKRDKDILDIQTIDSLLS